MQNSIGKFLAPFLIVFFIANSATLSAQSLDNPVPSSGSDNSPYNQFGIGSLSLPANAALRGMSGNGAAYSDQSSMNPENPATYSFLKYTVFGAAFEARSRIVSYEGRTPVNSFTGNMAYLNLAFPIKKFGAFGFGINPVSNIFYNLRDTINITSLDKAVRSFYGDGGLQNAFGGLSAKIKSLSLGINVGYTFGTVDRLTNVSTLSLSSIRNYEDVYTTVYGGWNWNAGLLYRIDLSKQRFLNIGLTYAASATLQATRNGNSIARTYGFDKQQGQNVVINLDTLRRFDDDKGTLVLPSTIGAGLHFGQLEHYDVNVDMKLTDWSGFSHYGLGDSLRAQTVKVGIGGSYTPNASALYTQAGSYFSAITYRAGFYYNQDYVYLRNMGLNDIGGSFGMSFPLRRSSGSYQIGKVNAIVNAGSRGTLENGLARELYFNLTIGASLSDLWFIKPVYE